jgi:hypothetical protein
MNETVTRSRRAKHIDHYVGPGIIIKHIGTRSLVIRYIEKDFQRNAGTIMLEKPRLLSDDDPTIADRVITFKHRSIQDNQPTPRRRICYNK